MRWAALQSLTLTVAPASPTSVTCRSRQDAARHAWEQASLMTALSHLPSLAHLEISQPAVTPDLLLLRLFYSDFLEAFPVLREHDLVQSINIHHVSDDETNNFRIQLSSRDSEVFRTEHDGSIQVSLVFFSRSPSHSMFRNQYKDAPIISPEGPVSLHELMSKAAKLAKTRLAERLSSLRVRGDKSLMCSPLILLACPRLRQFSMTGR